MKTAWLLALGLILAPAAQAADPPPLTPLAKTVAICAGQVKARTPASQFDAYVDPAGDVRYFGTKEEWFAFEKCLAMRGIGPGADEEPGADSHPIPRSHKKGTL